MEGLRRLNQFTWAQLGLLVRAVVTLAGASGAVAFCPFKRAVAFGNVELGIPSAGGAVSDYVWAVEAAARRVPWRALCFEQGLSVQHLLRKDGVNAILHYGARQHPSSGKLEAHVWVSVAGETVIGGDQALEHEEIASFP